MPKPPADRRCLGPAMREIRRRSGISQVELARRVKCTARWLNELESGRGQPDVALLARIARELGVPLDVISMPVATADTGPETGDAA